MKRITLSLPAPYVGLRPFDEKDALLFFGREAHVRDLLAKLEYQQRFISVIGASGSGKSSLVRAGLIPALHRGALASAGHCWKVHITKPGDAPLQHLVEKLTEDQRWIDGGDRAASMASLRAQFAINPLALAEQYQRRAGSFNGEALLLVVDQFEEIFRYRQQNIDEAEAFINLLLRSASEDVPVYVVITMRSDFLGHCVAFFDLPEAINSGLYLTPRLRPEQLKSIIASPLALIGSDIDPVLVNRLINTLEGDDELPILEHALLRMWNHARENGRNRIEEQNFAIICKSRDGENDATSPKLAFAIGNHASEIYDQLTPQQQAIAQQIFPALVERRENRDVRRPQTFEQLIDLVGNRNQDSLIVVIDAFRQDGAGFLLPPATEKIGKETLIDISHESFFRQWHLYKQWLDEEALDAAELKEWHYRWMRHQQTGSGWLDDNDSYRASQWLERTGKYHNPQQWALRYLAQDDFQSVKTFIQTSQQIVKEKQQAETVRLEKEVALQRQLAEHAENQKQQAEAFARSSRKKSFWAIGAAIVAIVFGIISAGLWQHAEQLARNAHADALIATAENLFNSNRDQSVLLALSARHINNTPKVEAQLRYTLSHIDYLYNLRGHKDSVNNAQFAPDGKSIVTASSDNTTRLWDAISGKELAVLRGHEGSVFNAQFAPDGKSIVTASGDKTARLWDAVSGKELAVLRGHEAAVNIAQFSPDGQSIVTASWDNTARLWDAASGKELAVLRGHEAPVNNAQFSPDGQSIVTASQDNTARLWDAASGKELAVLRGHEAPVNNAQFSPDGQSIVTASADKTARLWDAASGKELAVLCGHEKSVINAQFSPDGQSIVTASLDSTARLWDAASGKGLAVLRGHEAPVSNAQFSPDGQSIVTASADKTARLWDAASGKELAVLRGHEAQVINAQFAPDGKTIVTASDDKTARLWDAVSGKELAVLRGHEHWVNNAQFAPDGKSIVTAASEDKTARLWACNVCRSIDEIAAELKRRVGRDLTEEERRRFGVVDIIVQE